METADVKETWERKARALNTLLPPSAQDRETDLPCELAGAVMIRANYNPGDRHRLGWRGIQEIPGARPGTLTAKVASSRGVFGLLPAEPTGSGHTRFGLYYFPDPGEDLVESFSIEAGLHIVSPDFIDRVRQFSDHPGMHPLFRIAHIEVRMGDGGIYLVLAARERLVSFSPTGIRLQTGEGEVEAVPPGGIDRDIPARALALSFFRVLAASFTYTLAEPPGILYGAVVNDGPAGEPDWEQAGEHPLTRLTLGYFSRIPSPGDIADTFMPGVFWTDGEPFPAAFRDAPWWKSHLNGPSAPSSPGGRERPGFILLTGFLGAGKTTFLNRFIQAQTDAHHFVAVVQNEIGEKGLDDKLLNQGYAVTSMDEGCVCCSLAGNLRAALGELLDEFHPDVVVLETTGLANPANMLREIEALDDILEFRSITTLVDAFGGPESLARFEVARDQVRLADQILLNKTDLVAERGLGLLEDRLRQLNPLAGIHQVSYGDIHPGLLYGVNFRNPPRHPGFGALSGNATHMDDAFETRLILPSHPLDPRCLERAIRRAGDRILRAKGIAEFDGFTGPMVVQYTPGTFRITPYERDDFDAPFLVVIGRDLDTGFKL